MLYQNIQDDGVDFDIEGTSLKFRGTLTAVVADNIASQYIGGYLSLNAALRKCRFCMAVADEMTEKV